jgi:1-acyl-sn-glycerol-3-phosphate acyltransferase
MKRPLYKPVIRAYPDINAPESKISKLLIFVLHIAGRIYLTSFIGAAKIKLEKQSLFIDAFRRSLGGESRCIIAFRHPYGFEPQLLTWFVLCRLKKTASRQGIKFPMSPRLRFIYGYEVLRWGGLIVRIVMPNLGALPIHHSKLDSRGMTGIYAAIAQGPYPVGIAPEGQVSYTSSGIPRLEPGIVRIGIGAAGQLIKEGKSLPVEILPVSVRSHYSKRDGKAAESLLRKVEKLCGIEAENPGGGNLAGRFLQCREIILRVNEKRYAIIPEPSLSWDERITVLLKAALDYCAGILGIRDGDGDGRTEHFSRMYYLRQICWDRIFIPGKNTKKSSKESELEFAAEDLRAGEAWHAARHIEIADFAWYFRAPPPEKNAPPRGIVEYVQNLWDFANRTMGGAYTNRVNIHPRHITIQAGPAINLSAAVENYRQDRKGTVQKILSRLEDAYLDLAKAGEEDC